MLRTQGNHNLYFHAPYDAGQSGSCADIGIVCKHGVGHVRRVPRAGASETQVLATCNSSMVADMFRDDLLSVTQAMEAETPGPSAARSKDKSPDEQIQDSGLHSWPMP